MKKTYNIRLLFSKTKYEFNRNELSKQLNISQNDFSLNETDFLDYNFKSRFLRLGGKFKATDNIQIIGDVTFTQGEYSEKLTSVANSIEFDNTMMSLGVEHAFSYFVNLKIFYQMVKKKNSGQFMGNTFNHNFSESTWGGNFELLF